MCSSWTEQKKSFIDTLIDVNEGCRYFELDLSYSTTSFQYLSDFYILNF
jgi:hypothetical protein